MLKETFQAKIMPLQDGMFRFAYSYLKCEMEAKDVVQDVLLKLWETRKELTKVINHEAWAMTLIRNKSLDKLKSARRKNQSDFDPIAARVVHNGKSPHEHLELKDEMELVNNMLERIPAKHSEAFVLRDVQGMTYQEIGEILDMNESQVKVNIFRARKALKKELENKMAYGNQ